MIAVFYGVVALVWLAAGRGIIPGRWFGVHVFTLGVLSNLVMAFTDHFARTLLHSDVARGPAYRLVLLNAGVLLVILGLPSGFPVLVGVGATLATAAVMWVYLGLRRMRRQSLTSRFAFVVRGYERACGAFVHGALLGLLMGLDVLGGGWFGAARLAHLHINLLGWGGLTLLATIVFFGPTMLRRRIAPGAETVAAGALRWASTGLSAAAVGLLLTGAGAPLGTWMRVAAGVGLVVYAWATTRIWLPVARVAVTAAGSLERVLITFAGGWFVAVAWADAVVVMTGTWRVLDALGAALLLGVLLQAIIAALAYLGPMVRGRTPTARSALRGRLQRLALAKAAMLNLGAGIVVVASVAGGAGVSTAGWLLIALATVISAWPLARAS
jgi:nitrite reductase (NO-forming)